MFFSFTAKCKCCGKIITFSRSESEEFVISCPHCQKSAEYRDMSHFQHLMDTIHTVSDRNDMFEIKSIEIHDL